MKVKRKQDLSAVKWSPERPVNVSGRSIGLISHALDTMAAKKRNLSNTSKKDPESCTPVSPPRKNVPLRPLFKDVISHMKEAVSASLSGNTNAEQRRYTPRPSNPKTKTSPLRKTARPTTTKTTIPALNSKKVISSPTTFKGSTSTVIVPANPLKAKTTVSELQTKPVTLDRQERKFTPRQLRRRPDSLTFHQVPAEVNVASGSQRKKQNILYADPERKQVGSVQCMLSDAISKVFAGPALPLDSTRKKGSLGKLFANSPRNTTRTSQKTKVPGKLQKAGRFTVIVNQTCYDDTDDDDGETSVTPSDSEVMDGSAEGFSGEDGEYEEEETEATIMEHDSYTNHIRLPNHEVVKMDIEDSDNDEGEHDYLDPLDTQNTYGVSNVKLEEVEDAEEYGTPLFNGFSFHTEGVSVDESSPTIGSIGCELLAGENDGNGIFEDVKPSITDSCETENYEVSCSEILPEIRDVDNNLEDPVPVDPEFDLAELKCDPNHHDGLSGILPTKTEAEETCYQD